MAEKIDKIVVSGGQNYKAILDETSFVTRQEN